MKVGVKNVVFAILLAAVSASMGYIAALEVQKYAIREHGRIKEAEKEALKQKIERENRILIRRLEEDFEAFRDSVTAAFVRKKKEYSREHGLQRLGSSALKHAVEARIDGKKNRVVAERRKQVDRKIEDLKMRLDF